MNDKKILVIEDNELNMKLVRTILQIENYKTLEAANAEEGISLAREHKPDLILMDIQLPGMDGLSATKVIKEDPDLRQIPIVALSGHALAFHEAEARDAGCIGYIAKPYSVKALLKDVGLYLHYDGFERKVL